MWRLPAVWSPVGREASPSFTSTLPNLALSPEMDTNLLANDLNFPIYYLPTPTLHSIVTAADTTPASTLASASTSASIDQTALVDLTHDNLPSSTIASDNLQHVAPTEAVTEPSGPLCYADADVLKFRSFYHSEPPAYASLNDIPNHP